MDMDLFLKLGRIGRPAYVPVEVAAFRLHASSITMTKGTGEESEAVRLRGLSMRAARRVVVARRVTRYCDRLVYGVMARLPSGEPPGSNGIPYTKSRGLYAS
jgi:hypothetical protein